MACNVVRALFLQGVATFQCDAWTDTMSPLEPGDWITTGMAILMPKGPQGIYHHRYTHRYDVQICTVHIFIII